MWKDIGCIKICDAKLIYNLIQFVKRLYRIYLDLSAARSKTKQTDGQMERQTCTHSDVQKDKQTDKQRNKQLNKQSVRRTHSENFA